MEFLSKTTHKVNLYRGLNFMLMPFLWLVFILFLVGMPGYYVPQTNFLTFFRFDLFVHAGLFAFWVLLILIALNKQKFNKWLVYHAYFVSLFCGILLSGLTELFQGWFFLQRSAEFSDFLANTIGCMLGALSFKIIYNK